MMTVDELAASALAEEVPPKGLPREAEALWHAKRGHWEEAHEIAQEIHTPMGSWVHALLHLIEGDVGNANYWYHKARRHPRKTTEIEAEWREIAAAVLEG